MRVVTDPHIEVGKGLVKRLREQNFTGYVRSCIEELLAHADAGRYSFADLGISEVEVLDLAIGHIGGELLRGHNYPFAFMKLKNDLLCRKSRIEGMHTSHHPYALIVVPTKAPANDRKAA